MVTGMATIDVLSSPALPVLVQLQAAGVRFRLAGEQVLVSPRGALTAEQREVFGTHREAVRAFVPIITNDGVQARLIEFRRQLEAARGPTLPAFLLRAHVPYVRGVCFSCGDALPELHFGRCWRCSLAWRLACQLRIPADLASVIDSARLGA